MSASPSVLNMNPAVDAPRAKTRRVLKPRVGWHADDFRELWHYRDLLWFLALRDIQIRYKQSLLGAGWAVARPLTTMIVLNVFFGQVIGLSKQVGDVPYPIFLYAGLLPWQFFAASVTAASNSMIANAQMLRKIYFPRILAPMASMGAPVVDFVMSAVVMAGLIWWFGVPAHLSMLYVIPAMLTVSIGAIGVGLLLAAWAVSFRDVKHIVPFLIQTWFFVTPVIYPVTLFDNPWARLAMGLNPMSGTIDALRASVTGQPIDFTAWAISAQVGMILLLIGTWWFQRTQRKFADIV